MSKEKLKIYKIKISSYIIVSADSPAEAIEGLIKRRALVSSEFIEDIKIIPIKKYGKK